jgi:hypothetical protein
MYSLFMLSGGLPRRSNLNQARMGLEAGEQEAEGRK